MANAISKKIDAPVSVGKVDIMLPNRIVVDDLLVFDQNADSMLMANRVAAKIRLREIPNNKIDIISLQMFGVDGRFYKKDDSTPANFQFALDSLFKKKDDDKEGIKVALNSIIVRRSKIGYDRYDKEKTEGVSTDPLLAEKKQAFDIAKFAGIFAAIGMALGMIGTALAAVAKGMSGFLWWQYVIVFVCILLVISGPSMIMAYMKLRRRNLAPVLNANGWAVNADAIISVPFGRTLTEQVAFPIIKIKKKGLKPWAKWLIALCVIAVILGIVCLVLHLCGFCWHCLCFH